MRAPALPPDAGPWLNGASIQGWGGAVTLVDFWTYSCVNCLRTLPALREWHARYGGAGLRLLGVHTPEFPFERDPANVARATRKLGVGWPVVLDNDRAIWERFANRYWPHRYLIDARGRIRHDHAGEGGETATERAIRAALAEVAPGIALPPPAFADDAEEGDEPAMGAVCVPATPELFAGYYRGVSGNPGGIREDAPFDYSDPGGYREGYIHLHGRWRVDADAATFIGPEPGYLRVAFRGDEVNAVLARGTGAGPVEVRVAIAALAEVSSMPTTEGSNFVVDTPRLYHLRAGDRPGAYPAGGEVVTLTPAAPGLAIYSFTFGACGPG